MQRFAERLRIMTGCRKPDKPERPFLLTGVARHGLAKGLCVPSFTPNHADTAGVVSALYGFRI